MKSKRNLAFIVELFIMFILLLVVIVVITTLSIKTRDQSIDARYLNEAVICAENAAELTASASDADEVLTRMEKMDGVANASAEADVITADMNFKEADGPDDQYTIIIKMSEDKGSTGKYITKEIKVTHKGEDDAIYTLKTGNFVKGAGI